MPSRNEKERILVVDDSRNTLEVLQRNLMSEGYRVLTAPDVASAIAILEGTSVDLVITDMKMPKVSGLDLVRHIRENFRELVVVMITGYPSIDGAVQAVKTGAEEYLPKPFTDDELFAVVRKTLDKARLRRSGQTVSDEVLLERHGLIGESQAMAEVLDAIAKARSTSATVLITGESGTGKELVARAIHYNSPRASSPFVPVNCGGIPEGLLESALFGHVKGAFTGAAESHAGFFHAADGGSIFLDEIAETSSSMQVKLLRVLQDKEINMVGSSRTRKVDMRILAATNRDLASLVKQGRFREDFYYRLNVITIGIPPLRERDGDVLSLLRHYAAKLSAEAGKPGLRFSDGALRALGSYDWPGNVRELENVVQRLVVMTSGEIIDVFDLPSLMRFSASRKGGFNRSLAEIEADYISNVVISVEGNKTQAARILGIDRKTLREKLKNSSSAST